jgi:DNA-binding transcriptional regulator YhcF (GntR family)
VRELAQEASVNPNTMQRALSTLESDGLLISNRTSGRFVTNDESEILKLKKKLAEKNVAEFLQMMSKLGFTKDEIQNAISKSYIWEDNNGNNT